ncbi:MAG: phenylacetate--CoA ligase [Spirochaetota bacterium]
MMYNTEYEAMHREDLEQLQIERLQAALNRVYRSVAFYKNSFDVHKINIEKFKSLNDIKNLPFTTKEDLRKSYPYNMFAVPLRDIVRIHSTSGTTGKSIVVGYTRNDINNWTSLMARVLTAAGITEHDFIQIAFNYSLFTGGFGFHYGAEKLGASVIPSSNANVARQIDIMKDYKTTTLVSTPGFALHIAAVLKEKNIHPEELSLKTGLFGAEPWSQKMRSQIEESLHIKAYDNYGLTEIMGPGVAFECSEQNGLHVNEDHFIVEIVDPNTLEPLPPGEKGEIAFTTITKQGFPLIRYRTGDISSLVEEPCPCGRTLVRMNRITGRTDDMIIVEGTNVFPSQIEEVLLQVEGIEPHYQIILRRESGVDVMEIKVEVSEDIPVLDEVKRLEDFRSTIQNHLFNSLGIQPIVTLAEPKTLSRSTGGKLERVIDNREI